MSRVFPKHIDDPRVVCLFAISRIDCEPELAYHELMRAATIAVDDPVVVLRAATHLATLGASKAALRFARKGEELAVGDHQLMAEAKSTIGRALAETGENDAMAEQALKAASEMIPANPVFLDDLANFMMSRGRTEDASRLLECSPSEARASARIKKRLETLVAISDVQRDT